MTGHGTKLSEVTPEEITNRLAEETNGKAVKRLVAAREYLNGHSPAEIEAKYGWPEQTVYTWLNRLEESGLEEGLYDEPPPGRPAELTDDQFEIFRSTVEQPPGYAGFDAPAWTSALAREFLCREFDIEYSRRHVRRLLKRAGFS